MTGRARALSTRLLLASLLALPVFMGLSGYMLDKSFQRSQSVAQQEQLQSSLYLLMAAAELDDGSLWMPDRLQEPRFNHLNSGLLATISSKRVELWRSPSSELYQLPMSNQSWQAGAQYFYHYSIDGEAYFAFHQDVDWELSNNETKPLRFTVLLSQSVAQAELSSYRAQLWRWLGTLSAILLILQWAILYWGLKPFGRVAKDLEQIEQGKQRQLRGSYPKEITPVINNLNRVLESEQQQRERYRNTMADLAHSLKTPLAIIRAQLDEKSTSSNNQTIEEQLVRMDQIIQHQLKRAIRAQSSQSEQVLVLPLVERLTNALRKIHTSAIDFQLRIDSKIHFSGDSQDLMEVLGNLLENACKYGGQQIRVTATYAIEKNNQLQLIVEDNGPGIPESQRTTILERGARADTVGSGQGIGLAVVIDILSSYNGSLAIEQSEMGGARFVLGLN